jgi:DNA-binding SARP family transcriptional activator
MVEVRILGSLEVTRGGTPLTLGGTKQRALFAMLALRVNRVVSMDSFVEGLWGSATPNDPANVIQVYLYRLRKVLRPTGTKDADDATLVYCKPGYLLQLDPEHLDLHRFQRLVQEGSHMLAAAPDTAAATLTDALALWRGAPLVEFDEQPFARTEISRLRELQLSALSTRIRADLAVGRHAELIAELEDLTGQFPLHEGFRAQLMLSLYRSGRHAEALDAYRRARAVFAAEAGIDPGRALQDLEAAVLVQDPLLDWKPPAISAPAVAGEGRADPPRDGERLESAPARLARVSNVPARNPHFTGRTGLLDQLHDRLRTDGDTLQVQALYGLGGVGKTQLAIEYAYRYAADYDLAWYIDAEQPLLIPDQLIGVAGLLGLPFDAVTSDVVVDRVLTELSSRTRWLLIFDNAEHPTKIAAYRPRGPGHVLVTSRYPGWGALGGRVEVDVLDRSETVALLRVRIPEMTVELADKLAAELGDLPLAAAQAAGYLEQTGLPSSDYLRRLRSHRVGLLADGDVLDYQGRVDTTWEISLARLRAVSPAAVALLEISAFLASAPIPLSLFTEHPDLLDETLHSADIDTDALTDAVGAIVGFSLARRREDCYQVHRLVQAVIRHRLPPVRHETARGQAIALLAAAHPGDPRDSTRWHMYASLAPHVIAVGHVGDSDPAFRQLMLSFTVYQMLRGGDLRAHRLVTEELHERWQQALGADHPDTLRLASMVTFALAWTGDHDKACILGQDTLQRLRRVLGCDHPDTLRVAASVTFALAWTGEYDEASALGQDTLQRQRRVLGADHPDTLRLAATVTFALAWLGDVERVRELTEDALHRSRQTLGPNAPGALGIASSLILAMVLNGDCERARSVAQDTVQRARTIQGSDNPITLYASVGLALALIWAPGSVIPADDNLQGMLHELGPGHRSVRSAAVHLDIVLSESGPAARARKIAEDTWHRSERNFGLDHSTTHYVQAVLALAMAKSGDSERARELANGVLQNSGESVGRDHLTVLLATAALTIALIRLGQADQAWGISAAIVQPAIAELGEGHPLAPTLMRRLACVGIEPGSRPD